MYSYIEVPISEIFDFL